MAPKPELVRIALSAARAARPRAVIDLEGTMPGRGAYLCRADGDPVVRPAAACAARALGQRGLARALRAPVRIDDELIESMAR